MTKEKILDLLNKFKENQINAEEIISQLSTEPYKDLGFAKVDNHRSLRWGYPEVIFCPGKRTEDIIKIIGHLLSKKQNVLATRANESIFQEVHTIFPQAEYHPLAKCITISSVPVKKSKSILLVMTAGTADIPVAEEAAISADFMGITVERLFDVGVAGIHRLLDNQNIINQASVIIVVAGMEGALASVVGGLVDKPVIAVPTSIGYGTSFGGITALLGMLNSCASGVGVVNIDNGFGAAALAHSIIRQIEVPK